MRNIIGAVLSIAALGCETPTECHGSFYFNETGSLTQADKKVFLQASKTVNAYVGYTATSITSDGICPINEAGITGTNDLGWWDDVGLIEIDIKKTRAKYCEGECGQLYYSQMSLMMTHELLHSLGLQHHTSEYGVMSSRPYVGTPFSDADRAECVRVGVCTAY